MYQCHSAKHKVFYYLGFTHAELFCFAGLTWPTHPIWGAKHKV